METESNRIDQVLQRLDQVQETLAHLLQQRTTREWYSTDEIASILGKAEFTVREWCRLGRINAEKKTSGRGKFQAWVISHAELLRFQREGLLPIAKHQADRLLLRGR